LSIKMPCPAIRTGAVVALAQTMAASANAAKAASTSQ
jgi:hypothetical protein